MSVLDGCAPDLNFLIAWCATACTKQGRVAETLAALPPQVALHREATSSCGRVSVTAPVSGRARRVPASARAGARLLLDLAQRLTLFSVQPLVPGSRLATA